MSEESPQNKDLTKLLVVDDEDIILNIATDVLESEGYDVTTETNPIKALEIVRENKFDFVLTDINMPEMNGLDMVKKIQEIDSEVGAIFMTGYANLETAKGAIQTGAYDYIMKPFELNELRAAVTKAVEKRREQVAKTEGGRLDRLSDLVEVLYTVGDKTSLLKLSLGLALVNSGLTTGFISCWEKKSEELVLIWTDNVRQSDFKELVLKIDPEKANECFNIDSPFKTTKIENHPFVERLSSVSPVANSLTKYFREGLENTTLKVLHREQFLMLICVEDKNAEESLSEGDMKLLNIVLNMAMVVVENVLLLSESQQALAELEKTHEQVVNLERVATQGIMSAEIGHELNNYLNIVRSNFELLKLKANISNIDVVQKYMRGIEESLEQMTRFTTGLVDSARLKSEKVEVDLDNLIEDTISFLSPQKKYRGLELTHESGEKIPKLRADTRQLQQLLYNICNNAAEAFSKAETEKKTITIITDYIDSNAYVEIRDNGCGIPADLVDKAFSNRFTTKASGHGFGLMVCKKVVENHNGTIEIESTPGEGTAFKINIPVTS